MEKLTKICSVCAGTGESHSWIIVTSDDSGGTAKRETKRCTACDGKGTRDFAIFTMEEASKIMEACGITSAI